MTLFTLRPVVTGTVKGQEIPYIPEQVIADGFRSFVEFETAADLKTAVEKLDGREFKGVKVTCFADVCTIPSSSLASTDNHRLNRMSPAIELVPAPLLADPTRMTTTAVDLPEDTALVVTVIVTEAHLAVATMMMIVDVMADLLQEPALRLMITLLLAALALMILIVANTHPLTPTSMAMADLTTVLHHETTHQEMLDTLMIIAAVTSNSSFQGRIPYGLNSHE